MQQYKISNTCTWIACGMWPQQQYCNIAIPGTRVRTRVPIVHSTIATYPWVCWIGIAYHGILHPQEPCRVPYCKIGWIRNSFLLLLGCAKPAPTSNGHEYWVDRTGEWSGTTQAKQNVWMKLWRIQRQTCFNTWTRPLSVHTLTQIVCPKPCSAATGIQWFQYEH